MKKSIKLVGIVTAALLAVAPVFTTSNTTFVSAKTRTHKTVKVSKKIAVRIARNKRLVKQVNAGKIYLFYPNSFSLTHHILSHEGDLKDVIGFQISYFTDKSFKYRVNKKTGNIESINTYQNSVDEKFPGYGFSVHKILTKDKAYTNGLKKNKFDTKPLKFDKAVAFVKKGEIVPDSDGLLEKVLTYKGHQYFTAWGSGVMYNVQPKDVTILNKLPKDFDFEYQGNYI